MVRDRLKGPMRRPNGKPAGAPSNGDRNPATTGSSGPARIVLRRIWDAIVWSKLLRRLIYPVDLLLFLCYRAYIEGIRKRVLIMDRYFYDTLVDVADGRGWGWIRLLKLITPTPTLPDRYIEDRKSTRLNSSHVRISYAVFCLKKKKKK